MASERLRRLLPSCVVLSQPCPWAAGAVSPCRASAALPGPAALYPITHPTLQTKSLGTLRSPVPLPRLPCGQWKERSAALHPPGSGTPARPQLPTAQVSSATPGPTGLPLLLPPCLTLRHGRVAVRAAGAGGRGSPSPEPRGLSSLPWRTADLREALLEPCRGGGHSAGSWPAVCFTPQTLLVTCHPGCDRRGWGSTCPQGRLRPTGPGAAGAGAPPLSRLALGNRRGLRAETALEMPRGGP